MAVPTLDDYLEKARGELDCVAATALNREIAAGALVVDVRPRELRESHGALPGAMVIGLNVLEWRLAPTSEHRSLDVEPGRRVILFAGGDTARASPPRG